MEHIIQLIGVALIGFISTNIDDFFVLTTFFSDDSYNKKTVIIGQYIGMFIIIAVSCVGFIFKMVLPIQWVGILGILPIIIGSGHLAKYIKNRKNCIDDKIMPINTTTVKNTKNQQDNILNVIKNIINSKISFVAMVTFSNGP